MGIPIILYGRLYTKYETIINDVDAFADIKNNSVISTGGEVVVPASGETPEDISRASVIAKPGFIIGGDLNIIKPNKEYAPVFIALTISNGDQQKKLSKKAQGKSVVHLHNCDLKQLDFLYPALQEQMKIAVFLTNLDHIVSLHQMILDKYRNLKQAYLNELLI
jgi:type I restriction enzyme S subunit